MNIKKLLREALLGEVEITLFDLTNINIELSPILNNPNYHGSMDDIPNIIVSTPMFKVNDVNNYVNFTDKDFIGYEYNKLPEIIKTITDLYGDKYELFLYSLFHNLTFKDTLPKAEIMINQLNAFYLKIKHRGDTSIKLFNPK